MSEGVEFGYIEFKDRADEEFKAAVADALAVTDLIETEWYGDLLLISEAPRTVEDYPDPEPPLEARR